MKEHKCRAVPRFSKERCFSGCVNHDRPNEAAHGGIVVIDECRCGKQRHTNVNGRHVERGVWA